MKIIDPHIHLFNLEQGDYHWLKTENPPFWPDKPLINKTFTENDLALNPPLELSGFVHIEAGFDNKKPWRELTWLEQACKKPFQAIAAIDLTLSRVNFQQQLEMLAKFKSFIGVRHILDGEALSLLNCPQVLSNFNVLNAFAKSNNRDLVFETQLPLTEEVTISALCQVINDNPNINFIINHAGFPPIHTQPAIKQKWHNNLNRLSAFPQVAIKCSGWEMVDRNHQPSWLEENLTKIFSTFNSNKIMLASNFPLCFFSQCSYQAYWQLITSTSSFNELNHQEKVALCYSNAYQHYQFKTIKTPLENQGI